MEFEKKLVGQLKKCYSVAAFAVQGRPALWFASEEEQPFLCVDALSGRAQRVDGPGGVMGMTPLPGADGAFLAGYGFYPPFLARQSGVLQLSPGPDGWRRQTVLECPYLHRFTVWQAAGRLWLVYAVLCRQKAERDDWSSPGYLAAAPLRADGPRVGRPLLLQDGLHRNHGFCHTVLNGRETVLAAADEGVFALQYQDGWRVRRLLDAPAGEAVCADLDGDGQDELAVIAPFHGDALRVYHQSPAGWHCVWQCPQPLAFGHSLWAGRLHGEVCGLCGYRRGEGTLFRFWYENGGYHTQPVDGQAGSSNLCVTRLAGRDCILSANHSHDEAALYLVKD